MTDWHIEVQRAHDALAFEPLPVSPFVVLRGDEMVVRIAYSERLSRLLGELRGAQFRHHEQEWVVPITAHAALRAILPDINRLGRPPAPRPTLSPQPPPPRAQEQAVHVPLRREYLTNAPPPEIPLTLESIGAHSSGACGRRERPRDYVSQVMGFDDRGREVLRPVRRRSDYADANSVGSRGIRNTYLLAIGLIYKISAPQSWRSTKIYYARVATDGSLQEMTSEEVAACAKK